MTVKHAFNRTNLNKSLAVLFFVSAVILLQGCGHHNRSTRFASHKVTNERNGITNRFGVESRDKLEIFHYDGVSLSGERLRVRIENDKVVINDKEVGLLNKGDAVHLGDEGIRVNSMDYGQSEKYLKGNLKQETATNL